jgi:DNA-binding response OmpR family regulator
VHTTSIQCAGTQAMNRGGSIAERRDETYARKVMAPSALFIGDAEAAAGTMHSALAEQGFRIDTTESADVALERAADADVIVLDLGVPEADPIETCRRLRAATDAYIVAVGERRSELELVLSLSVGADDFIARPVQPAELVARVRAMLRRPRTLEATPQTLRVGDLEIDTGAREVRIAGDRVDLSTLEFDLLRTLAQHPKLTLSREQLLRQVWGPNWFGDDHVIDVHISNLRRKLRDDAQDPKYIRTVRGYGFRIQEQPPGTA